MDCGTPASRVGVAPRPADRFTRMDSTKARVKVRAIPRRRAPSDRDGFSALRSGSSRRGSRPRTPRARCSSASRGPGSCSAALSARASVCATTRCGRTLSTRSSVKAAPSLDMRNMSPLPATLCYSVAQCRPNRAPTSPRVAVRCAHRKYLDREREPRQSCHTTPHVPCIGTCARSHVMKESGSFIAPCYRFLRQYLNISYSLVVVPMLFA